jgi:hypothetical protein
MEKRMKPTTVSLTPKVQDRLRLLVDHYNRKLPITLTKSGLVAMLIGQEIKRLNLEVPGVEAWQWQICCLRLLHKQPLSFLILIRNRDMKYTYYGTDYSVNWRGKRAIEKEQAKLVDEIRRLKQPLIGPKWQDMTEDERAKTLEWARRSAEQKLDERRQQRKSKRPCATPGRGLLDILNLK